MPADGNAGYSLIVAIYGSFLASIGAAIAVVTFWMRFENRITTASMKADAAVQEAAEAKNETENLRDMILDKFSEIDKFLRQNSREHGEGLAALRQHHTDLAFFMRDNFVRATEFNAAMTELKTSHAAAMAEIKAGQLRMETKLDQIPKGHAR